MKQAIVNFCKSMDTGLFLLDMPTGFGKTYSVLEFMVDYYDSPEFKDKKIFFVTTLKKNLPDKELREHFAKRGKADDYDKYCLRIEANADMVVEKLDELYRARKIPAAITMKQEFKDLHGSVKLLNEYRDKKRELKGTSKDIINVLCKNAEDAIRKQQEGAFRKVIESELKQFRTPKEKLKNIANNPEYHWIGELYPAVYTRAKRIFFMSMDKFFLGNTTIIEPTYSFYNNDITKNAIIFIDEFDATKDTNMYSMPDYTAMGDVLKNVASEGRFPGKDVVTWLRLVMDTTDKIKVHAELDIVIPHIDVNAEYTKANVMGLFKGITTKKEVVRYVFENTGIMLYAYLRGEEERREYLSGNIDINYFDYDDTHAKYSVGEIGNGMKYTIERASVVREIQAVEGSKLIFKKVLPLMGVEFVRYGMLTVVPFPFKYLREYIVKEEKSV